MTAAINKIRGGYLVHRDDCPHGQLMQVKVERDLTDSGVRATCKGCGLVAYVSNTELAKPREVKRYWLDCSRCDGGRWVGGVPPPAGAVRRLATSLTSRGHPYQAPRPPDPTTSRSTRRG